MGSAPILHTVGLLRIWNCCCNLEKLFLIIIYFIKIYIEIIV
jgi:hypothetical protein